MMSSSFALVDLCTAVCRVCPFLHAICFKTGGEFEQASAAPDHPGLLAPYRASP